MQCGLVPVNGQVRRTELEFLGGTWQRAAPTEPVPWTPGAPATAALNNLQHEWVLVAQTVIAETKDKLLLKHNPTLFQLQRPVDRQEILLNQARTL
jgi:hypothetical protein